MGRISSELHERFVTLYLDSRYFRRRMEEAEADIRVLIDQHGLGTVHVTMLPDSEKQKLDSIWEKEDDEIAEIHKRIDQQRINQEITGE